VLRRLDGAPGAKLGEIFEPCTIQDKIDVAADTRICIPLILDLVERTVIWSDLALRSRPRWRNNVESNQTGMWILGKAMTTLAKPDLYTLFELHAQARGALVDTRNQADTIFAPDTGVTPFDSDRIVADYL
jgi:hypothetical protein